MRERREVGLSERAEQRHARAADPPLSASTRRCTVPSARAPSGRREQIHDHEQRSPCTASGATGAPWPAMALRTSRRSKRLARAPDRPRCPCWPRPRPRRSTPERPTPARDPSSRRPPRRRSPHAVGEHDASPFATRPRRPPPRTARTPIPPRSRAESILTAPGSHAARRTMISVALTPSDAAKTLNPSERTSHEKADREHLPDPRRRHAGAGRARTRTRAAASRTAAGR